MSFFTKELRGCIKSIHDVDKHRERSHMTSAAELGGGGGGGGVRNADGC